jgi:predicted RNA polymerase sigma factor
LLFRCVSRTDEVPQSTCCQPSDKAQFQASFQANRINERVRLKAELDRARQELALLKEEVRIKDARMARIPPPRRPHYPPSERMAILELKTARGWSLEQAARTFFLAAATIAYWLRRTKRKFYFLREVECALCSSSPLPSR